MNTPTRKVILETGKPWGETPKKSMLRLKPGDEPSDELLKQASRKGTDFYEKTYCQMVLKKKFPSLRCDVPSGRQKSKPHDNVKLLTDGWISSPTYNLDEIKTKGKASKSPLWSDDYWRLQWGATSYRYETGEEFEDYDSAVKAYKQPSAWQSALKKFRPAELALEVAKWSPAEKYDLTVADKEFSLTKAQKAYGWRYRNKDDEVEAWMGICHGWAAASIMVPRPSQTARSVGPDGVSVKWYPADVRAMVSLAWASSEDRSSNFVGGRCEVKDPKTYENGRLKQDACFDNAPDTFHLALGNLVGAAGRSFVMDKTFDYEVWNQPIHSYEFTWIRQSAGKTGGKWP
jgi:hypothetical protein